MILITSTVILAKLRYVHVTLYFAFTDIYMYILNIFIGFSCFTGFSFKTLPLPFQSSPFQDLLNVASRFIAMPNINRKIIIMYVTIRNYPGTISSVAGYPNLWGLLLEVAMCFNTLCFELTCFAGILAKGHAVPAPKRISFSNTALSIAEVHVHVTTVFIPSRIIIYIYINFVSLGGFSLSMINFQSYHSKHFDV